MTVQALIPQPISRAEPRAQRRWRTGDRQLWLCILLTICIVLPQSLLITHAHSESVDDDYHLDHGLSALLGTHQPLTYNDPPLGEIILVLPLHLLGVEVYISSALDSTGRLVSQRSLLHGQRYSPETLRLILAAWKALLFLPCVAVAFVWMRRLYGTRSAWLAAALLLVEPTIAAHIPVAALDVLAMEAVIIACFLIWRYFQQPSPGRLIAAGVATAAAMLIKHTAILLPLSIVVLAGLHWFVRPWWQGQRLRELAPRLRPAFNALAGGAIVVLVAMWPLTVFDVSKPSDAGTIFGVPYEEGFSLMDDLLHPAFSSPWPAGIYIGSICEAMQHGDLGHSGYLWGEIRMTGWWYYFFAAALYKVPIGIALVMVLAIASLGWVRPKWDELFILVPMLVCGTLLMISGINIGFRHALPTYGLLLLLASRCVAGGGRGWMIGAWAGVLIAAVHVASYHPDYLSYINAPWKRPWLAITDSNLDWGQSLKQLNQWLQANPQPPGRPIYFDGMDEPSDPGMPRYVPLRHRLTSVSKDSVHPPTEGLLITSPLWLVGVYHRDGIYAHLRDEDPIDIIGHCLLVYDLDRLPPHKRPTRPAALSTPPTIR